MASQIILRLNDDTASRFRSVIPARQRNKFVADLVETALRAEEAKLTKIAEAVNAEELADPELLDDLRAWERTTIADGLDASDAA
jgi:hypothetical protein